ncbi:ABC transporter permease [Arthrobacter gengyunqii]|uniref:Transport permease protein n=1 Tax=Arthrobacter gengyunqii TaxID=2886940 RepID=A0A9X1M1F2_9MICC|nr:ABC transporter permease [Arthrobacter gengyunqii]MCC3266707.1 ABC transporter permease [Arthrobacter gengyunqii]MCC3269538.1 ABC transporter permease [Arthrobacter gengyunqii]UOY97009.1 ABC transporter permease [Arthrobacter gengyunqii]
MTEHQLSGAPVGDAEANRHAVLGLRSPLTPEQTASRTRRFGAIYYAEHWIRRMRGYGWTVLMTAVGTPLVYLFGMGVGLASLVDTGDAAFDAGDGTTVSYLVFVAPALLATAAIMVAAEENTYMVMGGFKWHRTYYGPNASPLSSNQLVDGHLIGFSVRMLITTAPYFLFLLLFGAVEQPGTAWLMIFTAALGGVAFGMPLMAYSASLEEDKGQFAMVQRFIVMPLFLFSGTFFPLESLPGAIRWIGWISPLWHSTELGRILSYGYAEAPALTVVHVAYLLLLGFVGWVLARRNFTRRLGK